MQRLVRPIATVALFRELGDEVADRVVELVVGNRTVDHAPSAASRPRERTAEQQELLRAGHADESRQKPRSAAVGAEAALHERLPEAARLGRDREVGRERDLAPESGRPPVHRAHDGQLHLEQELDDAVGLQGSAALDAAGARGRVPSPALLATKSAPVQKSAPAPRITTTRSVSSTDACSSVETSRSIAWSSSAFLRAGRSSTIPSTPPSRSGSCSIVAVDELAAVPDVHGADL